MKPLPWQQPDYMPSPSEPEMEKSNMLNLSLFEVTGPFHLSAYVLAHTGQDAIDALTRSPDSPWGKLGAWDEHCQAEYIGQTMVPKKNWFYLLANMDGQRGLIMSKSL